MNWRTANRRARFEPGFCSSRRQWKKHYARARKWAALLAAELRWE